jgi:hypothetical protein
MSYLAHLSLTFTSEQSTTYETTKRILSEIGLYTSIVGDDSKSSPLPRNTFAGKFEGGGASKIRDDLFERIRSVFGTNAISAACFLSVGGDSWAWKRFKT